MLGQWLGTYSGTTNGNILANIDIVDNRYECVVYLVPNDRILPSTICSFSTDNMSHKHQLTVNLSPINPNNHSRCDWNDIKHLYNPTITHSRTAEVKIELKQNNLLISAVSDLGYIFESKLDKPAITEQSKIIAENMSWSDFKSYVSQLPRSNLLFRGQQKPWRLVTSFHRRARYRINEFVNTDVKKLHQRLMAITPHYFNLSIPEQNGAFFNLLQHHGYPTPLLDWSYSPYVSAFFAFRGVTKDNATNHNIRIFIFDNQKWQTTFSQIPYLDPPFPHLSVSEFIAISNTRMVPQQAVTTVTNLDDIEEYILKIEQQHKTKYLTAIDIPASQRDEAMNDLRYMGITAGSMFPGIDGVCEELREYNFSI